jgi:predicted phage tail protein
LIDGEWNVITSVASPTTSYLINDLEDGEYTYSVSAVSASGESDRSAEATVTVVNTLAKPTNVSATYDNGVVTVTWDAVTDATGYNIYVLVEDEWTQVGGTVTQPTTDADVTGYPDGEYTIGVTAVYDDRESEKATTTVTITTTEPAEDAFENNNTIEAAYSLGAITDVKTLENLALLDAADYYKFELTAKGDTKSYVRVAFDVSLGDIDLQVYNASKKAVKSASSAGNSEQISLNGLAAGIYYLRVYGYRQATNPSYSITFNPPAASVVTPQPPTTPTGLIATENENVVTLNWNNVTDAVSYNVYRQDNSNLTLIGTVTGTSYSINGLTDGTYNFAVSAVSSNGESEKTATSITLVSPPATPSNLSATQTDNGQVSLTWNVVTGAESYNVYRQIGQSLTLVGTVTSTSCTFNDLGDGLQSFAISAVSSKGESDKNIVTINIVNEVVVIESADDSYENNNTIDTAYNLGAITSVVTVEGLALLDSADYYKFELTAKGDTKSYVRIAFDVSLGDIELQVYNASKKAVKSASSAGNSEQISLNGLAAGIYYIRVYGYRQATNPSYSMTFNPPAASVTSSSPIVLSAASSASASANSVPTLTGDYQIYANNSAIVLNDTQQQNNNYAYSNLSNQFFATPAEFLVNAPVIEIVGHEVSEDGKIRLQWIAQNNGDNSTPIVLFSDFVSAELNEFQIIASFTYYSNGTTKTGIVKSNVYLLSGTELLKDEK